MYTLISGGLLVDGTGSSPFPSDVLIRDGIIVAIGPELSVPLSSDLAGDENENLRTIDAHGCIVTPGFIDIHTHYDGQASWDAELRPSSVHGVTTAVLGSCGVGFAPVHAADRTRIIRLMEGVEDIPGAALSEGIQWRWESVGEYMAALDSSPHTIDLAVTVPHDPLRVFVMGDRAAANEPATPGDIETMCDVLREALAAGAVGFSTGRSDNHKSADGLDTPAAEASRAELIALSTVLKGFDHRVLQIVSDFDLAKGPTAFDGEFELVEAMAEASQAPLSLSLMQRIGAPNQWRRILDRIDRCVERGLNVRFQCAPRGIGVILGLEATFHPFIGFPSYMAVADRPLPERVAHLRRPDVRAQLLTERSVPISGDGSPVPPLVDFLLARLDRLARSVFRFGSERPGDDSRVRFPNYEPNPEDSIFSEAEREHRNVLEVLYDALLENEGQALLYFPIYNYAAGNLSVVADMLHHPRALIGLGDGGAHVGTICDSSFPAFLLAHWVRDRSEQKLSLERAVQLLTGQNAAWMGFTDRGVLAVGKKADVNVIDLKELNLEFPYLVRDLPAGGKRFLQNVSGIRYTLVSGQVIARDGQLTPARPGRLVRASCK